MDRTIASARSFLAGFFSSEKEDNKIQAKGKLYYYTYNLKYLLKKKGPFEIEVHHFPDEDMVNSLFLNNIYLKTKLFFFFLSFQILVFIQL